MELRRSSITGIRMTLAQLGDKPAFESGYADLIFEILRWVEETQTRALIGKSDKELAEVQARFLEAEKKKQTRAPAGWGGAAPGKTRWEGLLKAEQAAWTKRAQDAVKKMAAHCVSAAPELGVTESTFEIAFEEVDSASLGAIATVGSKPGKTVQVGFEFVVAVEMNPAYALSTVVHELVGHAGYDPSGVNYMGSIYQKAAGLAAPGTVSDPQGYETYQYWPSEIYSLLKEIPYWTPVSAADVKKTVNVPGSTTTMDLINYDPRGAIKGLLGDIKKRWDPSLHAALLRGFYQRLLADPSIQGKSALEFVRLVEVVFGAAVTTEMTK